jgi:hypothetical protein
MIITTTKCKQFGHPEFVLEADEAHVPDSYLWNIAQTIEDMVASGSVFKPRQNFQIGWMLTHVQATSDGHLTLFEPDMETFPIKQAPGITHALRTLMLQLFMLDSVSLRNEMKSPSIVQSLLVCTRYTEPSFFMERTDPAATNDSGWFVGCLDESHDHNSPANIRRLSLYEAYLNQRGIQGFVSFPIGAAIVLDQENGLTILKGEEKLAITPGSFLDAWFKRQRQ